jgi:hypothetical protein
MTGPRALPSAWRRPETALFVLTLGVFAYFFQAGGWNSNSRLALVRSLVERHTVVIDGYEESTGDLAFRNDHYYCDKAPGLSWLAVPAYAAVDALAGAARGKGRTISRGAYVSTVWAVALPSAAAVVALYLAAGTIGLTAGAAAALALFYAFGTLAFPYSTLFYGHQLAAALLFTAFVLLLRARRGSSDARRLLLTGLLLGGAITVEYPAALAAAVLLVYALSFLRSRRHWVFLMVGMAAPLFVLFAYHTIAFGAPLRLPYAFSTDAPRHQGLMFGLRAPSPVALWRLTVSPFRGLFFSSPWLLLAAPGALALLFQADRRWRAEALVCAAVPLLYLGLNASMVDWNGGWAMGPRHLVPALPFLALLAGGVVLPAHPRTSSHVLKRALAALGLVAAVYSIALMLIATTVKPEVPTWIYRPFGDYLVPRFLAGDVAASTLPVHVPTTRERREAWNVGLLLGLEGWRSLLPLAAWALFGLWWLRLASKRVNDENVLDRPRPG